MDASRLAAVNQGSDLKNAMNSSGLQNRLKPNGNKAGDPDDKFYIMQAEHMIKNGNSAMALHFVNQSLEYNRENRVNTEKRGLLLFRVALTKYFRML